MLVERFEFVSVAIESLITFKISLLDSVDDGLLAS